MIRPFSVSFLINSKIWQWYVREGKERQTDRQIWYQSELSFTCTKSYPMSSCKSNHNHSFLTEIIERKIQNDLGNLIQGIKELFNIS